MRAKVPKATSTSRSDKWEPRNYKKRLSYLLANYRFVAGAIAQAKNRSFAMSKNTLIGRWPREVERNYLEVREQDKKELEKLLHAEGKRSKAYLMLRRFPGMGVITAAEMANWVDIGRCKSPGHFWGAVGLGTMPDGTRQRPIDGKELGYNERLKGALLHNVAQMALLQNKQWRPVYLRFRRKYSAKWPGRKMHIHRASLRRLMQQYLIPVWAAWRKLEGLPTEFGATS